MSDVDKLLAQVDAIARQQLQAGYTIWQPITEQAAALIRQQQEEIRRLRDGVVAFCDVVWLQDGDLFANEVKQLRALLGDEAE